MKSIRELKLQEERRQLQKDLKMSGQDHETWLKQEQLRNAARGSKNLFEFDNTYPYVCHKCGFGYSCRAAMRRVETTHTRSWLCRKCGAVLHSEPIQRGDIYDRIKN